MKSFKELRFSGDHPVEETAGRSRQFSPREQKAHHAFYLQNMVKVSAQLLPDLSAVFEGVKDKLGLGSGVECYVCSDPEPGAFCVNLGNSFESGEEPLVAVVLNSGLVNLLADDELAVIIGHEIGHFLFSHREIPRPSESRPSLERLNALQLHRAAEISCDRIGFICCPKNETDSLEVCFRAMLKTVSGLSEEFFRVDVSAYIDQIRENQDILEHSDEIWSTHPMFPLRVKALRMFSLSEAYYNWAGRSGPPVTTEKMDSMIEKDFSAICGMQMGKLQSDATSRVKLWGALRLFIVDDRLTRGEQEALTRFFGEDKAKSAIGFLGGKSPEEVMSTVEARLNEALGEARALSEGQREALVRDLERFAGGAGGGDAKVIKVLKEIAGKLGIERPVRILRLDESGG